MAVDASDRELEELRRGKNIPGDFDVELVKPEWYDELKFLRGKKFFKENLMPVFFSEILYLIGIFSFPSILKVLISTENSSTPIRALKRYVLTIRIFICWFKGDIWNPEDPAYKSLLYVMKSHKNIYVVANSNKKKVIDDIHIVKPSTEDKQDIYKSIRTSNGSLQTDITSTYPYVSQWDLMIVQHAVTAGMVAHPEAFGAWDVCREDIEGFLHCWRVLGHFMGIRDEFNMCKGDVENIKSLVAKLEEEELIAAFGNVDYNFEHMSSVVVEGLSNLIPGVTYPSVLLHLLVTLGADVSRLYKALTLRQKMSYYFIRVVTYSCKARFIRNLMNSLFEISFDLIEGGGPWWWPGMLTSSVTIPPSRFHVP